MEKLILSVNCYTFPFEFIPRLLFFHDCVLYKISMNKPLMVQLYLSSRTIFLYFLSRCCCTKISFNLRRTKSEPKILFYEKYLLSVILILICTCSFLVFQLQQFYGLCSLLEHIKCLNLKENLLNMILMLSQSWTE